MQKIIAVIFLVLGIIALVYGGFSYTSDVHTTDIGSLDISFSETEHVNIPVWGGVTLIVVGGALLLMRKKI